MSYDLAKAISNPTYKRDEWRLFINHPKLGDGTKFHYLGNGVESMSYAIDTESTEKNTIAQSKPIVTNVAKGLTFPAEFEITERDLVYESLLNMALLDKVNEEFDVIFVYGNVLPKVNGSIVPNAVFAKKATAKFTVSAMGGDGVAQIKITSEGKTTGDVLNGYASLTGYSSADETLPTTAFTEVAFDMGDLVIATETESGSAS